MNIQILDSWLREYLKTKAKPEELQKYLSLCGPSVEKVFNVEKDYLYDIEITTNRIDTASVIGIAREASTILPTFKVAAEFNVPRWVLPQTKVTKPLPLAVKTDKSLTKRVMAIVLDNIKITDSPSWMKKRLESAGIRSLNNVIDITNFVMLEVGHPTHVFDYDKIDSHFLNFRLSKKGEELTTLDGKIYELPGGDIVIEDAEGAIIDLPGIMGTKNSVVDKDTKRIIFFIDNNDPVKMRRTSMSLGLRSVAVTYNEKGVDPALADLAFARGVLLYQELAGGRIASKVIDIKSFSTKFQTITTTSDFINKRLGVMVSDDEIKRILNSLGFMVTLKAGTFTIEVPSFRALDVTIEEDIVEEIARIYGYHNLPSRLMEGGLPEKLSDTMFKFENKLKYTLKELGGVEMYSLSLVSRFDVNGEALKVKNPLGGDTEYLRTNLKPALMAAYKTNAGWDKQYHLFELSNVYLPRANDLPIERLTLGGIFVKYDYRDAKGVIEALLDNLNVEYTFKMPDQHKRHLDIVSSKEIVGKIEVLEKDTVYYEIDAEKLRAVSKEVSKYKDIPKYPAQIEDHTFIFPPGVLMGEAMNTIKSADSLIVSAELTVIYKNAFTFRFWYQHPQRTLTDKEVTKVRTKVMSLLEKKFKAQVK